MMFELDALAILLEESAVALIYDFLSLSLPPLRFT